MSYRIAGIDVHKKMLAVVVTDVEIASEFQFERRMFGSNPEQLKPRLSDRSAESSTQPSASAVIFRACQGGPTARETS